MQNLPSDRRFQSQARSNAPKPINRQAQHFDPKGNADRRPPLRVQQNYIGAPNTGNASKTVRVPAVNTLKAGGPRLAMPPSLRSESAQKKHKKQLARLERERKRLLLRDFLLGLAVGMLIFGVAAIFVCKAVVDILSL